MGMIGARESVGSADFARAREVLRFWFAGDDGSAAGCVRPQWFAKDDAFDASIAARFGRLVAEAIAGRCDAWGHDRDCAPALVVVLDQFTRNVYRDTPRMFAGDARALVVARRIVALHWDDDYDALLRWFCYMPFEHSESLDDQDESLRLFAALRDDPLAGGAWRWAVRHHEIIERFGRFPHRNAILGRKSTAQELAFLKEPGSAF
ncbi:MAG: DUF924 domain-containing protein [Burkholderiaceae bacterium]|nr:DUF924 domain-containing protein [Burkholderiaceae bacterium]